MATHYFLYKWNVTASLAVWEIGQRYVIAVGDVDARSVRGGHWRLREAGTATRTVVQPVVGGARLAVQPVAAITR